MRELSTARVVSRVLVLAGLLFVFLVLHIWVRMQFVTESFRLSGLRSELRSLEASRALKQVKRDELYNPHHLEQLNKMEGHNLGSPQPEQIVDWYHRGSAR